MDMRDQHENGNRMGQKDAYGNPIQQQATDACGNPIHQTAAHGEPHQATYGHEVKEGIGGKVTGASHGAGAGGQAQMMRPDEQHRGDGILRRSGSSSSSSSSEDDGMGGRRKKGLMEKIKEKLPGGQKTDEHGEQHSYRQETTGMGYGGTVTTTAGATGVHQEPEKKGMMEKIKEKLPGHQ